MDVGASRLMRSQLIVHERVCVYACVNVCAVNVCVCLTPLHQSQQEKIDSIEDNVNTAAANVEEGTKSLGKVCVCVCVP